jgi:phage-related protein
VAAAFNAVLHVIEDAWHSITSSTSSGSSQVQGFFQRLPGEIVSFLARLPGDMVSIGQNIIHGLINGIESMGGTLASAIVSLIPSPIRSLVAGALGIFSPSTVFHGYGVNLVQGLINGVQSMQPHLRTAMTALTGGVTATGSSLAAGAIAPAGGSTSVHVTVPTTVQGATSSAYSSPEFTQYMQAQVQEAVLRYGQLNPGNGLTPAWGR